MNKNKKIEIKKEILDLILFQKDPLDTLSISINKILRDFCLKKSEKNQDFSSMASEIEELKKQNEFLKEEVAGYEFANLPEFADAPEE